MYLGGGSAGAAAAAVAAVAAVVGEVGEHDLGVVAVPGHGGQPLPAVARPVEHLQPLKHRHRQVGE